MKEMEQLYIEYVGVDDVLPYENNARHHEKEDLSGIRESIEQFGMNDPIGVWSKNNVIVEGHGRWMVCKEMGFEKIPIIHLDHMSDEERRAYALAHNKTAELSSWDPDILGKEIQNIMHIDMTKFGFEKADTEMGGELEDDKYTMKTMIPQYEITGECPTIAEMLDIGKAKELIEEIEASGVTDEEKEFLKYAAFRHDVFNYRNIAEYYAHAGEEMQALMEKSALVIIDVNDAIANGYATLNADILDMMEGGDEG